MWWQGVCAWEHHATRTHVPPACPNPADARQRWRPTPVHSLPHGCRPRRWARWAAAVAATRLRTSLQRSSGASKRRTKRWEGSRGCRQLGVRRFRVRAAGWLAERRRFKRVALKEEPPRCPPTRPPAPVPGSLRPALLCPHFVDRCWPRGGRTTAGLASRSGRWVPDAGRAVVRCCSPQPAGRCAALTLPPLIPSQVPLRDDQTYIPGLLNSQGTKVWAGGRAGGYGAESAVLPGTRVRARKSLPNRLCQRSPAAARLLPCPARRSPSPPSWSCSCLRPPQVRLTFKPELQQLWVGSVKSTQASPPCALLELLRGGPGHALKMWAQGVSGLGRLGSVACMGSPHAA